MQSSTDNCDERKPSSTDPVGTAPFGWENFCVKGACLPELVERLCWRKKNALGRIEVEGVLRRLQTQQVGKEERCATRIHVRFQSVNHHGKHHLKR